MNKYLVLIVLLTTSGLSGCNTMDGAGQDIQRGGEALSETANDVKQDM